MAGLPAAGTPSARPPPAAPARASGRPRSSGCAVSSAALAPPGDLGGVPPSFRGCNAVPPRSRTRAFLPHMPGYGQCVPTCFARSSLRSGSGRFSPNPSPSLAGCPDRPSDNPLPAAPEPPRTPSKAGFPGARQPPIAKTAAVLGGGCRLIRRHPSGSGRAPRFRHRASISPSGSSRDSHACLPPARFSAGLPRL